jgi:hypothetical protein
VLTFLVATTVTTLAAPYSGDCTWDYCDAIGMSVLTFVTAPWAIGAIYRCFMRSLSWSDLYVALCLMFFASSWFYDGYILIRDGHYPDTWLPNLFISVPIYIAAGLFWNLDWKKGHGVLFLFRHPNWYLEHSGAKFSQIIWVALPFMVFVAYSISWFVWDNIFSLFG